MSFDARTLHRIVTAALDEDIGTGDLTSELVLKGDESGVARAVAKNGPFVLAGMEVFRQTFLTCDPELNFSLCDEDGAVVPKGRVIAVISGRLKGIIAAERIALNFLQRMCGIATLTRQYTESIAGTKARILDTRKTMPGLRMLDKYAVAVGGGMNHRYGLFDAVLVKDNHISAAGGIGRVLERLAAHGSVPVKVEVEVKSILELEEVLSCPGIVDVIMLDNMTVEEIRKAVACIDGKIPVEVSGNVTLSNIRTIAETGVDFISVGSLTHSA
ncbi:MAG: carboxylating nicotinate-nucleotide diphosphorylase, partial [Deltaproteobacteria bacterium]|nr:carboxylating nicotinate-nucleotide diphosphorylase [Deltaproteobacteria bacterium]